MKNTINPKTIADINKYMAKSESKKQTGRRLLQLLIDQQLKNSNLNRGI